jgi:acyl-CoA thioesterase FadM
VSAACEFHRALRFEQEFDVTIRITDITRRTIAYSCAITQAGQKIATGSLEIACVSRAQDGSMKSVDIPREIAARFMPSPLPASNVETRTS